MDEKDIESLGFADDGGNASNEAQTAINPFGRRTVLTATFEVGDAAEAIEVLGGLTGAGKLVAFNVYDTSVGIF